MLKLLLKISKIKIKNNIKSNISNISINSNIKYLQ